MEKNVNRDFILETQDGWMKRFFIFSSTVACWWYSQFYLRPLTGNFIQGLRNQFGNGPFVQNVLSQSFPVDFTCLLLFLLFLKLKIIPKPRVLASIKLIAREGMLWGLLICIPVIPLALHIGYHMGFRPNWGSILGNVVSNSYEEFDYWIFLFSVGAYFFQNVWAGILVSAILFGLVHTQYPISMRILVGLAAVFFALAYVRSRSIFSALFAHQLSDIILDSILLR